ncbi:MAG: FAD:protein FMN transferase [Clostridia bacterium]
MNREQAFHESNFRAMNTNVQVCLESSGERQYQEVSIIEEVKSWFASTEQRFGRFLDDSELSYVNSHSGKTTLISSAMTEVLSLAEMYHVHTKGIFQCLILNALRSAGYTRSFEQLNGVTPARLEPSDAPPGHFTLDRIMKSVQLSPGSQIDLGGIVKGWSVEKLSLWVRQERSIARGLLNAGGDLQVWGGYTHDEPWLIGIASPHDPDAEAAQIELVDGAVATSSVLGRSWKSEWGKMHHLIDPRTMRPGASDIIQCSIVGDSVIECEVWAKVACILGSTETVPLLQAKIPHCDALFFTSTGDVHFVGNRKRYDQQWQGVAADFFHV